MLSGISGGEWDITVNHVWLMSIPDIRCKMINHLLMEEMCSGWWRDMMITMWQGCCSTFFFHFLFLINQMRRLTYEKEKRSVNIFTLLLFWSTSQKFKPLIYLWKFVYFGSTSDCWRQLLIAGLIILSEEIVPRTLLLILMLY